MDILIAYSILAGSFLLLASGVFRPRGWNRLADRHVLILRFGCFFAFLVLLFQIGRRLYYQA